MVGDLFNGWPEDGEPVKDPNKTQIGGDHYKVGGEEHWDRAWRLDFDCYQYIITKWVERHKKKGGLQDLEKARHALDKYITVVQAEEDKLAGLKAGVKLAPKLCRGCNEPIPNGHGSYCDNCWGADPGPGYTNQD